MVIPTQNEAANLRNCLPRLRRFDEVVVIDSDPDQATLDVANRHSATVIEFRWDGRFPKKRNWYLRNHRPRNEWVLFLDADELVDDEFCNELERVLPNSPRAGFWISYRNWFLGRPLNHGEPNQKLALIRFGSGEYERIAEDPWSGLDMEVHEHPILDGTVGELQTVVDHQDGRGLEHWIRKHNQYSTWEAHRLTDDGSIDRERRLALTPRGRIKYAYLGRWWLPIVYFLATYFGKLGFLDGRAGFAYSLNKAIYFWQIGLKQGELRDARRQRGEQVR